MSEPRGLMGHIRLGNLPRTRKWQQVVALLDSGAATTDEVAAATLDASKQGLEDAGHDPALAYSFWLLTQLPLCARKSDYSEELRKLGISVTSDPGLLDLVGAFSDSVDAHIRRTGGRTDLGEMAQMGAAESLTSTLRQQTESLGVVEAVNGNIKSLLRRGRGYQNLRYLLLKAQKMAATRTEFVAFRKAA